MANVKDPVTSSQQLVLTVLRQSNITSKQLAQDLMQAQGEDLPADDEDALEVTAMVDIVL